MVNKARELHEIGLRLIDKFNDYMNEVGLGKLDLECKKELLEGMVKRLVNSKVSSISNDKDVPGGIIEK